MPPDETPAGRDKDGATTRKGQSATKRDQRPPWAVFTTLMAAAVVLIVLYGVVDKPATLVLTVLILSLSALTVGGFFGFLFGIPRATISRAAASQEMAIGGASLSSGYEPSTNLEQVADWLTKILIGVGLVELQEVGDRLSRFGDRMGTVFQAPGASIVSQLVLVAFVAIGFVASFLWTRIYYGAIQTGADIDVTALLVRIKGAEVRADKAEKLSNDLATGELKPGTPGRTVVAAVRLRDDDPIAALPADVASRVNELRAWDALDWDSDPAAKLFPNAPREMNGRRLEAQIDSTLRGALVLKLSVTKLPDGAQLERPVLFLLHPTYQERVEVVLPSQNLAEKKIISEGWFTVIAITDDGATILGYPLKELPNVPQWFLDN